MKIAFVGTYLPRKCGIATYTSDLHRAVLGREETTSCLVVAMTDAGQSHEYPPEVALEIDSRDPASYERAADFLNRSGVEVVSLQHEFGIHGGSAGSHVIPFIRALRMPVVTTLHTVLRDPEPEQRRVTEALIRYSAGLVVMTERGRMFLREIYGAPADKIEVIPHGIHDVAFEEPDRYKQEFGVSGRRVLLTFGLLSPNKGIEHVIEALPAIVAEFPDVVYLVVGATHPNLVRERGEDYREKLERLVRERGLSGNVQFHNRFVALDELKRFIGAADLYLTPYLNERQIVSGTLAYAFGAGKAVVSTAYWHAAELLADGRGVLVPFADSGAIAREVGSLLRDEPRRRAMRENAYRIGRSMIWSESAAHHLTAFARAIHNRPQVANPTTPDISDDPRRLPKTDPRHVLRLTDSTGILQHSLYSIPNYSHGYCTDDNARALILATHWGELGETIPRLGNLGSTYLAFLAHAFDEGAGRFRNFMAYNRTWLEPVGSDDSHGRALWALGVCCGARLEKGLSLLAGDLFVQALPAASRLEHPRSWAFSLLGVDAFLTRRPANSFAIHLRSVLVERLMSRLREHARDEWHWLADDATYDNPRVAHALIASGRMMARADVRDAGLRALQWLVRAQTSEHGHFQPIGCNGFMHRDGTRARYDQQPVEAHAMVSACLEAWRATGRMEWLDRAHDAFEWFLGRNDLGLPLYDTATAGCCDALHCDRVNENQGAESTLAFHLALAELKLTHRTLTEPAVRPAPEALHA